MRKFNSFAFFFVLVSLSSGLWAQSPIAPGLPANIPRIPASVFPIGPFSDPLESLDPAFNSVAGIQSPWGTSGPSYPWYQGTLYNYGNYHDGIMEREGWNMWYTQGASLGSQGYGAVAEQLPANLGLITGKPWPAQTSNGTNIRQLSTYGCEYPTPSWGWEKRYFLVTDPVKWAPYPDFHFETYQLDNFNGMGTSCQSMWAPQASDITKFQSLIAENQLNKNVEFKITPGTSNETDLDLLAGQNAVVPGQNAFYDVLNGSQYGELSWSMNLIRDQFWKSCWGCCKWDSSIDYSQLGSFGNTLDPNGAATGPMDGTEGILADFVYRFDPSDVSSTDHTPAYDVQYQLLDELGNSVPMKDMNNNALTTSDNIFHVQLSPADFFWYTQNQPSDESGNIQSFNSQKYAVAHLQINQQTGALPKSSYSPVLIALKVDNRWTNDPQSDGNPSVKVYYSGTVPGIVIPWWNLHGEDYTSAMNVTVGGGHTNATAQAVLSNGCSGLISSITLTNPGTGYTSAPTITITGGGNSSGVTATATMSNGSLSGIQVTPLPAFVYNECSNGYTPVVVNITDNAKAIAFLNGGAVSQIIVTYPGSGYTTPPPVSISPPGSGTTATAVATINNGVVTGFNIINVGSGYTSAPTVTIDNGAGSRDDATATAVLSTGTVMGVGMNQGGSGYTSAPNVILTGNATAIATVCGGAVTGVVVTNPGTGYISSPTITFSSGNASTYGAAISNHSITGFTVNHAGSGYTSRPVVTITNIGAGASATASISGAAVNGITVTNGGNGYPSSPAPLIAILGGNGSGAAAQATVTNGVITSISVTNGGTGYTTAPTIIIGGFGASAAATLSGIPTQLSAKLVALTSLHPIFVRGWRFRDVSADRTLRGLDNSDLATFFNITKSNYKSYGNALQSTLYFSDWDESRPETFRLMAYIDNYSYQHTQKHITSFLLGSLPWYRAISEDQNGYPPLINQEGALWEFNASTNYTQYWPPSIYNASLQAAGDPGNINLDAQEAAIPYPADLIPARTLFDPNFTSLDWPISDPNGLYQTQADQTLNYQPGYSEHDNLFWNNISSNPAYTTASEAANFPPNDPNKWYAHIGLENPGQYPDEPWGNFIYGYVPPSENMRSAFIDWYLGKDNNNIDKLGQYHDPLTYMWHTYPFMTEAGHVRIASNMHSSTMLRAQAWNALSWGAKGIIFNDMEGDGFSTAEGAHSFDVFPTRDLWPQSLYPQVGWGGILNCSIGSDDIIGNPFFNPLEPFIGPVDPTHPQIAYSSFSSFAGTRFTDHWITDGKNGNFMLIPVLLPTDPGAPILQDGDPNQKDQEHTISGFISAETNTTDPNHAALIAAMNANSIPVKSASDYHNETSKGTWTAVMENPWDSYKSDTYQWAAFSRTLADHIISKVSGTTYSSIYTAGLSSLDKNGNRYAKLDPTLSVQYPHYPATTFFRYVYSDGSILGFKISNGGSNYTSNATVNISGGGGSGAKAVAVPSNWSNQCTGQSGSSIQNMVLLQKGSGYTSSPTVTITGGDGNASVSPILSEEITSYNLNPGDDASHPLTQFFMGYHDLWRGVEAISSDVNLLGAQLANLQWQSTVLYPNALPAGPNLETNIPNPFIDNSTKYPFGPYWLTKVNDGGKLADFTLQFVEPYDYTWNNPPGQKFTLGNISDITDYLENTANTSYALNSSSDAGNSTAAGDAVGHFEFGKFADPNEPLSQFVTVANFRTWPIVWDTVFNTDGTIQSISIQQTDSYGSGSTRTLLGAIDARQLFLVPIHSIVDPNNVSPFYTITNVKTGQSWTNAWQTNGDRETPFSNLQLEPGEGTLLKIAPATAVDLGGTNYAGIAYNNGNRTANVIESPAEPCSNSYRGTTWESNGSIEFSLVKPAGSGNSVYQPPPTAEIVFSPSYSSTSNPVWPAQPSLDSGHNPSIASKSGPNGDTIVIVFSVDDFSVPSPGSNVNSSERSVLLAYSTHLPGHNNPWTSWILYPIAGKGTTIPLSYYAPNVVDVTGNGNDLLTPVVTPISDGFVMAYAHSRDIHPVWVHIVNGSWTSTFLKTPTPGASNTDLRMPSLASRHDFGPTTCPAANSSEERIQFCYESDYGNGKSTIFYWPIEHDLDCNSIFDYGDFTPHNGWAVEVNEGYPACYNYHPHVGVINDMTPGAPSTLGLPIVSWEITDPAGCSTPPCPPNCPDIALIPNQSSGGCWPAYTKAAVRYMTSITSGHNPVTWSEITAFHQETNNLPQPVVRPLDNLNSSCSAAPSELAEVLYQDTFSRQQYIARLTSKWGTYPSTWNFSRLEEYAQWGSVSLPYEQDPQEDFGSILSRGIYSDENGLYPVQIVANPNQSHVNEVLTPQEKNLVYHLEIFHGNGGPSPCAPPVIGIHIGGGPCPTCSGTIQIVPPGQIPIVFPVLLDQPLASFYEVPTAYDTSIGGGQSFDSSLAGSSSNDSVAMMGEQPTWPITNDSLRTAYFSASQQQIVSMKRLLVVDTSQLSGLLPTVANQISYKLVMKDSASTQIIAVLDSVLIQGQSPTGAYPGTNPNDTTMNGIGYLIFDTVPPAPSGSAYITAIITKDTVTQANLTSMVVFGDTLAFPPPVTNTASDSSGGGGYKKLSPQTQSIADTAQLVVTVHPNPVSGIVKVCVVDIPGGVPTEVDVVNQLGHQVAILYNATPDAESGLCLSLDCTKLPSGIYYADLETMGMHQAVKFTVAH